MTLKAIGAGVGFASGTETTSARCGVRDSSASDDELFHQAAKGGFASKPLPPQSETQDDQYKRALFPTTSICYYMSGSAISVMLHEGLMWTRGRSSCSQKGRASMTMEV